MIPTEPLPDSKRRVYRHRKTHVSERDARAELEDDVCVHIFSVSAAMIGVCLTVIGLFRVIFRLKQVGSFGDDLLALDALLFLASCILSYFALRSRKCTRRYWVERTADTIFLVALCLMAVVCALITYELV